MPCSGSIFDSGDRTLSAGASGWSWSRVDFSATSAVGGGNYTAVQFRSYFTWNCDRFQPVSANPYRKPIVIKRRNVREHTPVFLNLVWLNFAKFSVQRPNFVGMLVRGSNASNASQVTVTVTRYKF